MKQKFFAALLVVASTAILFDSCKKKEDDEDSTPSSGMSAKVDGASWNAPLSSCTASIINGEIDLSGVSASGHSISFNAIGSTAGNYALGFGSGHTAIYTEGLNSYETDFSPTLGSFEITTLDVTNKKMSGKFHFSALSPLTFDSVVVTSGTFTNIVYTTSTGGGANELSCQVDGVNYLATNISVTNNVLAANAIHIATSTAAGSLPKLNLIIPNTQAVGTYNFSSTGNDFYYYPVGGGPAGKDISGQIIITVHNTTTNHIEGTFSGTGQEITGSGPIYTITNGSFSANY